MISRAMSVNEERKRCPRRKKHQPGRSLSQNGYVVRPVVVFVTSSHRREEEEEDEEEGEEEEEDEPVESMRSDEKELGRRKEEVGGRRIQ